MRKVLGQRYDDAQAPEDVAAWAKALYRDFRASPDINKRAALLDAGVARTIDGCYGLADAFREAANAAPGSRRAAMTKAIPNALESCGCRGVDVESLGFLLRLSPAP